MHPTPYKRLLLKLSGEMLLGQQPFGIQPHACQQLAICISHIQKEGFEIGLVIGGGNLFRGLHLKEIGLARTPADQMGMLSTLINAIALQQALQAIGCPCTVMSALECPKVALSYNWYQAQELLSKNTVLILAGGTGNPYFTTDTAAAMRASEIGADLLLKATKVDGIYNKDPLKYKDAARYDFVSYDEILTQNLQIMDATAVALCRSQRIPIFVFNMELLGKLPLPEILAQQRGTLVKE